MNAVVIVDCEAVVVDDCKLWTEGEVLYTHFLPPLRAQVGGRQVVEQRIHLDDPHAEA